MLSEIQIENLAVIEKASIPFSRNMNVFTGETGAGKSILIHGINAVLGQRVTKEIVRTGAGKAVVHALFTELSGAARKKLEEFGIPCSDGQLLLTREISKDGGSVARVNNRISTVSVLRELGEMLITIHGQHDNQTLLAPEKHLPVLDSFGGLEPLLKDYQDSFKKLQEVARKMKKLVLEEQEKQRLLPVLRQTVEEIGVLELEDGEDAALEEEFEVAQNRDMIARALQFSRASLSGEETEDPNAAELLQEILEELEPAHEVMPSLHPLLERLNSAKIELEDISMELGEILDSLDLDPEHFAELSHRRDDLLRIKKRYGPELFDVLEAYRKALADMEKLESSTSELENMKEERKHLQAVVTEKARVLSAARSEAATQFVEQVTEELKFLNMPNVSLKVRQENGKLTITGMDNIEFLISANLGEPPKPIAKIASGGELSRVMLALKSVIADRDDIPTLIFDEIDTGVSGRAAQKIGLKLGQIARYRQILCVTHLAQIAIQADTHLLIEKNTVKGRTSTDVRELDFEGRKKEVARIMGGDNMTELMLKNAEELLRTKITYHN